MEQTVAESEASLAPAPGLRANILSPMETLAQSISTIAPTTTPTMTIPLVFVLAGNGTWLAYLFATAAILLIALCISRFARYTSCSGSLYTYATSSLPPVISGIAGWALLLAYIATGASVTGGFINYANVFLLSITGKSAPTFLLALLCVGVSTFIAYRDVQVSARLMLWIEAISVALIAIVLALLLWHNGLHIDHAQLHLEGVTPSAVRLGVVLALFSFVGFESATTLGAEASNPLLTIPRAVIQSAVFTGLFFILCAYLETLGMHAAHQNLGESTAPMRVLANLAGVTPLGPFIDFGALVSMFACTLACITAAARVLMRMGHNGLVHQRLGLAHRKNATPGAAVLVSGILTALPVTVLALRGIAGTDIYGWMGSLAVYGFLTTYGLAAIALPLYLKHNHRLTNTPLILSVATTLAIMLALAGTLYPVPERPYNWLPYVYLAYILGGTAWFALTTRRSPQQSNS
ncbi:APC family permease [Tunturiibacter gelidoferens]|uniref:Amino acid transporter n=1 Tax=Tunturiibacter lichenicola TaxID=2051959 RepID=A0A7Y9T1S8_9BACT|nr:APC family permease [Edaphobacter lichenicola]NYF50366.1 amino acid transporter [Edaphobacter lichenicola]